MIDTRNLLRLMFEVGGNAHLGVVYTRSLGVIEAFDSGEMATLIPALEALANELEKVGDAEDARAARELLPPWEPVGLLIGAYAGAKRGRVPEVALTHALALRDLAIGRGRAARGSLLCKTKRGDLVREHTSWGLDDITCPRCREAIARIA